MSRIVLVDDGTLDTVVECTECRQQMRYNQDEPFDGSVGDRNAFIDYCLVDAETEHVCSEANDDHV